MKIKRVISGLLAATLLLTFTSCNNKRPAVDSSSDTSENADSLSELDESVVTDSSLVTDNSIGGDTNVSGQNSTSSTTKKSTGGSNTQAPSANPMDFSKIKGTTVRIHVGC